MTGEESRQLKIQALRMVIAQLRTDGHLTLADELNDAVDWLVGDVKGSAEALRMACRELWAWREMHGGPAASSLGEMADEADVDDVVEEMLGKARGVEVPE